VISETHASYLNPAKLIPPTFRSTNNFLQNSRQSTIKSGFISNYKEFDEQGYIPHKILDGLNL